MSVQKTSIKMYAWSMDVPVSTLRAELSSWIERAKAGEDVVITERGIPVARILAVDSAPLLDQLHPARVVEQAEHRAAQSARCQKSSLDRVGVRTRRRAASLTPP